MTRPIDIRDIVPRDAVLGDTRLGLDADENLAMTNQPDNSTIGTAASRNIGTAEDQIPLNSDLPASAKSGDYNDLDNLPTLGTVAEKDTGAATNQIPTSDILDMVGAANNWSSNNLDVFGDVGIGATAIMKNVSGNAFILGQVVAASGLSNTVFDAAGTLQTSGFAVIGATYRATHGGFSTNESRIMTRIS